MTESTEQTIFRTIVREEIDRAVERKTGELQKTLARIETLLMKRADFEVEIEGRVKELEAHSEQRRAQPS